MSKSGILPDTKKFLLGLILGIIIGCVLGQCRLIFSSTSNISNFTIAEIDTVTATPIVNIESTSTFAPTFTHTPTKTDTPSPTFAPTMIGTPLSPILSIRYTACGNHMAYSANTEITKIPIIENDQIIEYANYVLVIYKIRNTYANTPIYGFEIRPSPGYDNPNLYPHKSPMLTSDPLIQPNEEIILESEHIFMPKGWRREQHPFSFLKFPKNISPPYRYGDAKEGNVITFQVVEKFGMLDGNKEEIRCYGLIRIP